MRREAAVARTNERLSMRVARVSLARSRTRARDYAGARCPLPPHPQGFVVIATAGDLRRARASVSVVSERETDDRCE